MLAYPTCNNAPKCQKFLNRNSWHNYPYLLMPCEHSMCRYCATKRNLRYCTLCGTQVSYAKLDDRLMSVADKQYCRVEYINEKQFSNFYSKAKTQTEGNDGLSVNNAFGRDSGRTGLKSPGSIVRECKNNLFSGIFGDRNRDTRKLNAHVASLKTASMRSTKHAFEPSSKQRTLLASQNDSSKVADKPEVTIETLSAKVRKLERTQTEMSEFYLNKIEHLKDYYDSKIAEIKDLFRAELGYFRAQIDHKIRKVRADKNPNILTNPKTKKQSREVVEDFVLNSENSIGSTISQISCPDSDLSGEIFLTKNAGESNNQNCEHNCKEQNVSDSVNTVGSDLDSQSGNSRVRGNEAQLKNQSHDLSNDKQTLFSGSQGLNLETKRDCLSNHELKTYIEENQLQHQHAHDSESKDHHLNNIVDVNKTATKPVRSRPQKL